MGNYIISIIVRLWLFGLWLWIIVIPLYLQKEGANNFPSKEQIVYSEGILKTTKRRISHHHTVVDVVVVPFDKKIGITYYCNHTAHHTARLSSCFSEKHMAPYLNKKVRVGWYKTDDVLWFHNPHPQLVSLEVDGKLVDSYERNLEIAKDRIGMVHIIFYGFLTIAFTIFYAGAWISGRRTLKEYRNKSKTNEA